jgi:hypothetical protein
VKFEASVQGDGADGFVASCDDPQCNAHGLSPASALDALREEIRYRLELCPCTTVDAGFLELEGVSVL